MNGNEAREIAAAIVADYQAGRAIDNLELHNQADKAEILLIIDRLFSIVYGGYFHDSALKLLDARTGIEMMTEDCMYRLQRQISIVLPRCKTWADKTPSELADEAERITFAFFRRIPAVRALLDTDLQAILDGDPAATNKDLIIFSYPGFYAITVYRLAHELCLLDVPMIPRMMTEHAHNLTGIDIHPGASIGAYFFIDHGTGIVVGETTIIGEHVKLYQGVTLGALSTRGGQSLAGKKRHPTIQDNVTIYAGASVLGDITIGHDSVIGSNVFITEEIPSGTRISVKRQELSVRTKDTHAALEK